MRDHKPGNHKPQRILLVLNREFVDGEAPSEPLLKRGVQLARALNASLDLLHVCYEASLEMPLVAADRHIHEARESFLHRQAGRVSELVSDLQQQGVAANGSAKWGSPRADVILQHAAITHPDLILKQSRQQSYLVGALPNVDWTLLRNAPAPVWFVDPEHASDEIDAIVTALGTNDRAEQTFSPVDHEALQTAKVLSASLDARTYALHTYPEPSIAPKVAAIDPQLAERMVSDRDELLGEERANEARRREEQLRALTLFHGVSQKRVVLEQGHPGSKVPVVAEALDADLIIAGVHNRGFWNRVTRNLTAEPLLKHARCDVLFVRHPEPDEEKPRVSVLSAQAHVRPDADTASPATVDADEKRRDSVTLLAAHRGGKTPSGSAPDDNFSHDDEALDEKRSDSDKQIETHSQMMVRN